MVSDADCCTDTGCRSGIPSVCAGARACDGSVYWQDYTAISMQSLSDVVSCRCSAAVPLDAAMAAHLSVQAQALVPVKALYVPWYECTAISMQGMLESVFHANSGASLLEVVMPARLSVQAPVPVVALVGYTNAGKSTLLNKVTEAAVLAEDKLFATLDPHDTKGISPQQQGGEHFVS